MKTLFRVLVFTVIASLGSLAQTASPSPSANVATNQGQFTLSAKVVPLFAKTGTIPAADVGGTFAVTKNVSLRSDNIVAADRQGYFGSVQYFLSSPKILSKTNFDPSTFQFYLSAGGGFVNNGVDQRPGFLARGGVNYDPTHTGHFTVNLVEAGVISGNIVNQGGVKPMISGGLSLGW